MAKKKAKPGAEAPLAAGGPEDAAPEAVAADVAEGAVAKPVRAPRKPRAQAKGTAAEPAIAGAGSVTADPPSVAAAAPRPKPVPVPLDVPLEEQITKLPPLVYPGSDNEEFDRWASEKRRNRVRLEVIGAAVLLIAGVVITLVTGRPAFVAVALFGIVGLVAYEFLVTSFE